MNATCTDKVRRVPSPGKLKDRNWSSFTRKIKEEKRRGSLAHSLAERMSIQAIQSALSMSRRGRNFKESAVVPRN